MRTYLLQLIQPSQPTALEEAVAEFRGWLATASVGELATSIVLPDAIEAAQCMLPGAKPPPLYFLSDVARAWAIGSSFIFHSDCAERATFRD